MAVQADSDKSDTRWCSCVTPEASVLGYSTLTCAALRCLGGGEPKGSLARLFGRHGCGLLGGGPQHPGVGQDALDGQSVHRVVLQ